MQKNQNIDMEQAYQEYANLVYRFLYSYTRDGEWSQELTQETFLRAVGSVERYDGSCKFSTWLCQIAKHILYQELRKKKQMKTEELTENLLVGQVEDGEKQFLQKERCMEIYHAIHHLPETEREVVLYRMTGELSFREIGTILGKSENWSRTTFYRAKQKIKKELEQYE